MKQLLTTPIEKSLARGWHRIDPANRAALAIVLAVSVLAFGFEMTNLTFHHDDVTFIFVQDTRIGSYLGRFAFGWLHYFTQNAYIMPFLQMAQALFLMAVYGLLTARLWQLQRTLDIALVSALLCVFPYMAQIYQYNFCTVPFALAHLLAAAAVLVSTRATWRSCLVAAGLYATAFSIYQAVLANAATLCAFWLLSRLLFRAEDGLSLKRASLRPAVAVCAAAILGGLLYVALVSVLGAPSSTYQGADEAFSLRRNLDPLLMASIIDQGSRSFFIWPEPYFPGYLKLLQLLLCAGAAVACLWLPRGIGLKIGALMLLGLAAIAPRTLHLLHPAGTFHSLTLTAYAIVIAGSVMVIVRAAPEVLRSATAIVALTVICGYLLQCNWISTVNHQNTLAHFAQTTQILARVRAMPNTQWDGSTLVVAGSLELYGEYPFRKATGVATDFINARHLQRLTRLLRDKVRVLPVEEAEPAVREAARNLPAWPHPQSVTVVDGVAVVALGKPRRDASPQQ